MKRPQSWAVATASLLAFSSIASAETDRVTPSQGDSIVEDVTPLPLVTRPRDVMVWTDVDPGLVSPLVNSNKIYLNNCKPNGCVIRPGEPSSIDGLNYQGTWGINSTRTLSASRGERHRAWQADGGRRRTCSRCSAEITTTNPSPLPHFEIMIAGAPGDITAWASAASSPFARDPYIPNSLAFDFQKV